jgi:NADH-quinone oxidoreductase subunit N
VWLVVAAVLNSLASVYYYLRVVTAMYFREGQGGTAYNSWANAVVLVVLALLVLGLGIVPAPFMMLVQ